MIHSSISFIFESSFENSTKKKFLISALNNKKLKGVFGSLTLLFVNL
jgi:hypothetical protein